MSLNPPPGLLTWTSCSISRICVYQSWQEGDLSRLRGNKTTRDIQAVYHTEIQPADMEPALVPTAKSCPLHLSNLADSLQPGYKL